MRTDEINLIILDMNLSDLNGSEALGILKKINPDVKILLTTGSLDKRKVKALREKGWDHVLVKPYKIEEISYKLREILEQAVQN